MRFEVPQFIEIEDKIFGPLTWRQFLYLGGGVGMGVVLFLTTPLLVFIIIGVPLMLLSGALSFYPVNNRPFSFFLEAVFNYLVGTKLYLWHKKDEVVHKQSFVPSHTDVPATPLPLLATKKTSVASLARRLELQALQKKDS